MASEEDPRVAWLAAKVCASLGCDVASFTKLMSNSPATYAHKEAIMNYLDGKASSEALLIYAEDALAAPPPPVKAA
eukprot:CAMPEP_0197594332 /NCGR_PEP_ID=MMETSP1326-20131121/20316_1 /TAXON_ID=1155430 /ORGANISM="Genus nov. species nov., Strain RCC2288" /LENGTH=75 /DNA_ID=CAMNT_0043160491 /DNA_START=40 /DNA_END=264 /DNA_ORIENTATION=+